MGQEAGKGVWIFVFSISEIKDIALLSGSQSMSMAFCPQEPAPCPIVVPR